MVDDRILYIDANIFIFAIEDDPTFGAASAAILRAVDAGAVRAVTSELTIAEVLVKPMKSGRDDLVDRFLAALSDGPVAVEPVTRAVLLESARLRAAHGGRLADSIHVATALQAGCAALVSEDLGLRLPPALARCSARDALNQPEGRS